MADATETEQERISRILRGLPVKRQEDAIKRLKGSIRSLEDIVQRGYVNDDVAAKLSMVVSELRTARLLLDA